MADTLTPTGQLSRFVDLRNLVQTLDEQMLCVEHFREWIDAEKVQELKSVSVLERLETWIRYDKAAVLSI